jgi:GT2 family glycosyltransferase
VGALDEQFFIFFEDTDLGTRLRQAGWRSAVCESARIVHHGHQTVAVPHQGSDMDRQMLRSRYLYFAKHRGRPAAILVTVFVRLALSARAAKALTAAVVRHDGGEGALARTLWKLARYDPENVLPHERAAHGVPR